MTLDNVIGTLGFLNEDRERGYCTIPFNERGQWAEAAGGHRIERPDPLGDPRSVVIDEDLTTPSPVDRMTGHMDLRNESDR